jgi:hypothetical protein
MPHGATTYKQHQCDNINRKPTFLPLTAVDAAGAAASYTTSAGLLQTTHECAALNNIRNTHRRNSITT